VINEEVRNGREGRDDHSKVPIGWTKTTLGEILSLEYGKSLTKSSRIEGGTYPVYGSSGNVGFHTEFLVTGPALIVGRKGAAGAVHLCKKNFWPIDTTYFAKPSIHLSTEFIFHLLKFCRLHKYESSTAIPGLNRDHAYAEVLLLPPLAEQQRIVAKVEELLSDLDKGVENLGTAQQQLKAYRQVVLKQAFNGQLTTTAEFREWPTAPLGTLLDFLTSGSRGWAQYYADEGDIFIRAQNIKHDRLDLSDIAFVSLPERAEGLRTRVRKGDLLITITGANVTKSALVGKDVGTAYVSQHVALCRPTDVLFSKFLYWFIVSETNGRKQLNDMAYGAGKPGLNLENIRSVVIPLPDMLEQKKVVELIEEKLSVIDQLEKTITDSLQQAEALRQSILKKAFSGRLVEQNPEDEPASELLERIRTERAIQPTKARKSKARFSA